MGIPNANQATVHPDKIVGYELAREHPDGGPRAEFFTDHDFSPERPDEFRDALLQHARDHEVADVRDAPYGVLYTVEGQMLLPDDVSRLVRTVWQIDTGTKIPRFISAYRLTE